MGNADYMAAFLHVLLPVAFEVTAWGAGTVLVGEAWEGDSVPRVPPSPYPPGAEQSPVGGEHSLEGPPSPLLQALSCPSPPVHSLTLSWCSSQQDLTQRLGIPR